MIKYFLELRDGHGKLVDSVEVPKYHTEKGSQRLNDVTTIAAQELKKHYGLWQGDGTYFQVRDSEGNLHALFGPKDVATIA